MTNSSNRHTPTARQMRELDLESEQEAQECWFPKCSRKTVRSMVEMRRKGYPLPTIADKTGFHKSTVARYLRAVAQYGVEVFANDED